MKKYNEDKLSVNCSPDQIVNQETERPSKIPYISTIYRWIHKEDIKNITIKELRRHGSFKKPAETI